MKFLVPIVFTTGVLIRVLGGIPVFWNDLIYAAGEKMNYPGTGTPEAALVTFFMHLDRGDYRKAYRLTDLAYSGMTEDSFDSASKKQLGRNGMWTEIRDMTTSVVSGDEGPITSIRIDGRLVSACSVFRFEDTVEIRTDGEAFRIIVPGDENGIRLKDLFADVELIHGNNGELW